MRRIARMLLPAVKNSLMNDQQELTALVGEEHLLKASAVRAAGGMLD